MNETQHSSDIATAHNFKPIELSELAKGTEL
jgi:hypothetical protein